MEGFSGSRASMDEDGTKRTVFSELKPLCTELFQLLNKSGHIMNKERDRAAILHSLAAYVRQAPPRGLQPCLDYILFPLLLLLDASIACRSTKNVDSGNNPRRDGASFRISDSVAEGVLSCLEEVLKQCSVTSKDQLSMLLRKLTFGALLSPSEASEEFRHGIVKCLRAVLLGLKPCFDEACTCKIIPMAPFFISDLGLLHQTKDPVVGHSQTEAVIDDCLVAYLQSEDASAVVGHLLSLLLQIAAAEARRGHVGSGKLRADTISTLRVLIAKVGSADALAFFLPGIVSGLAKVLHVSKFTTVDSFQPTSGAAGSIEAIEQAIKGLAEMLVLCLADEQNATHLDIAVTETFNEGLSGPFSNNYNSADSALEALRFLSSQTHAMKKLEVAQEVPDNALCGKDLQKNRQKIRDPQGDGRRAMGSNFRIHRDKEWLDQTTQHVDSVLSATFPVLCAHPARIVRLGLVEAAGALLTRCNNTLRRSKPMLLECLLALACDDWESVSSTAHDFLSLIFSSDGRFMHGNELNKVFRRLIERLPQAILRGDETTALLHASRLLAAMYFAGPQDVCRQLFDSPAAVGRFMEVMRQSLSHTSAFNGPIEEVVHQRTESGGNLLLISELSSDTNIKENGVPLSQASINMLDSQAFHLEESNMNRYIENTPVDGRLPRMPPWFTHAGGHKLYELVAAIIRLAGLSAVAGCTDIFSMSILVEIPLESLRQTISELRLKDHREEDWYTWYNRCGSGRVLRDAATAVCVLSEIIYGASGRAKSTCTSLFRSTSRGEEQCIGKMSGMDKCGLNDYLSKHILNSLQKWETKTGAALSCHVVECVGNTLHEYMSSEIWDLPIDFSSPGLSQSFSNQQLPWHFYQDTTMLHQVMLEGLGVFGVALGKSFETSGFLYSSLYLLLEKLVCSNYHIQSAADIALQMFSTSAGYSSIKDMVVANMDYIIDSLCRQLRHLTLNPHAPNILAAILSSIGAARDILPLLEEPMRSISLELEVLARHQHPDLTVPILKALDEIIKALRQEAHSVTQESLYSSQHIKLDVQDVKERTQKFQSRSELSGSSDEGIDAFFGSDCSETKFIEGDLSFEHWEQALLALNERKRYRQSLGTVAGLCLTATIPLLGSKEQESCLKSLDVIENGLGTLSMIEEALKNEMESREAIEWVANKFSFFALQDIINRVDAGPDGNKLLPAINKVWPYLVICLKHTKPPVIIRCLGVIASAICVCGGEFFIRRFKTDGPHFLRLLSMGACMTRSQFHPEKSMLLPFRKGSNLTDHADMAQGTSLKIQEAFFLMLAAIARDKKSACALEAIFKQMAGLAVGFSCGSQALQQAATDALLSLLSIDPDLVWLLLADIVYSKDCSEVSIPSCPELPEISQLLPPSTTEYLWVQYAGQNYDLKTDVLLASKLLQKIDSCCHTTGR